MGEVRTLTLLMLCWAGRAMALESAKMDASSAALRDNAERNPPPQTNWREAVRQDLLNSCIRQLTRCSETLRKPSK